MRIPVFLALASLATADSFDCRHCEKHLLPQPIKLVEGRKYARDRRIDILHLKLDVTPDFAKRSVAGTTTMTFSVDKGFDKRVEVQVAYSGMAAGQQTTHGV